MSDYEQSRAAMYEEPVRYQSKKEGYSSGMIAAFVIVGIVVVGFLVLIILAVTLPAKYWGCDDDKKPIVPNGNNVVGQPSPAAVMVSGMGNIIPPKQAEQMAMNTSVIAGTHLSMAPALHAHPRSLRDTFSMGSQAPIMMNVLGADTPQMGGTVVSAPLGVENAEAPAMGQSPLIQAPNDIVSQMPLMSARTKLELQNPLLAQIAGGLHEQSVTLSGQQAPPVVSGASSGAVHVAETVHDVKAMFGSLPTKGAVVIIMRGCGWCKKLIDHATKGELKNVHFVSNKMIDPSLYKDVSGKIQDSMQSFFEMYNKFGKGQGFPQIYIHNTDANTNAARFIDHVIGYVPPQQLHSRFPNVF